MDVGSRERILGIWKNLPVNKLNGIILPPLINCHMHLELSHLRNIPRPLPSENMSDWIENLLRYREEETLSDTQLSDSMAAALEHQHTTGVVLIGDIANDIDKTLPKTSSQPEVYRILEVIAPTQSRTREVDTFLQSLPDDQPVSPHSPYSTTAELITTLKKRAGKKEHLFSIHLAESSGELELLKSSSGVFRDFLTRRKSWDGSLLNGGQFRGAVSYLDALGVLDEKTLCIHCVHLDDAEVALLAEKNGKVCLCPGSNSFLGVGRAPLEIMVKHGILPGIGTDSTASNESLSIWREMQILRREYPEIAAAKILAMATLGGAIALQREHDYGTIEQGKKPIFLEVFIDGVDNLSDTEIFDALTCSGMPTKINWIFS